MDTVIDVLGFLGAWLLVAGPLNQASIELAEEEGVSREDLEETARSVDPEPPVSPWWWLLPPVGFWKSRRRSRRQRERMMQALSVDQIRTLVSFLDKGTGWFLVASGAALIAAKETWELVERIGWPLWSFFVVYVVAAVLAAAYTVLRVRRSHGILEQAEHRTPASPAPGTDEGDPARG